MSEKKTSLSERFAEIKKKHSTKEPVETPEEKAKAEVQAQMLDMQLGFIGKSLRDAEQQRKEFAEGYKQRNPDATIGKVGEKVLYGTKEPRSTVVRTPQGEVSLDPNNPLTQSILGADEAEVERTAQGAANRKKVSEIFGDPTVTDYYSQAIRTAFDYVEELPKNERGEIEVGGIAYTPTEVAQSLVPHVTDIMSGKLFGANAKYRDDWARSMGYDGIDGYLAAMDERLAALQDKMEGLADKSIESRATRGFVAPHTMAQEDAIGMKAVRDARDKIAAMRNGSWQLGRGFVEGFDLRNALSGGLTGVVSEVGERQLINKIKDGKELTPAEQLQLDVIDIQSELDMLDDARGVSFWRNTGRYLGSTAEVMSQMAMTMPLARGMVKPLELGIKVAWDTTKKAGRKSIARGIGQGIFEGLKVTGKGLANLGQYTLAGTLLSPLQPSTYSRFLEKRNAQYSYHNGKLEYMPTNAWEDFINTTIEQGTELSSELFGIKLAEVMGMTLKGLGRIIGLQKMSRKTGLFNVEASKIFGWKKPQSLRYMEQNLGFSGDFISEGVSESWGDFSAELLKSVVTGDGHFEEFKNPSFWATTFAVSGIFGGAMSMASYASGYRGYLRDMRVLGKKKADALSHISHTNLKNALISLSSGDSIADATKALAELDWSAYDMTERGYAMDYLRAEAMQQVIMGENAESARLVEFGHKAAVLENLAYKGTKNIVYVQDTEGNLYYLLEGNVKDKEAMLTVMTVEGKKMPLHAGKVQGVSPMSITDATTQMYQSSFNVGVAMDRLDDAIETMMNMENPPVEEIRNVAKTIGITIPDVGGTITLVDGRQMIVESVNSNIGIVASYANEAGEMEMVQVHVDHILSNDANIAEAQRLQMANNALEVTEAALDAETIESGDTGEGAIVTLPNGNKGTIVGYNEDGTVMVDVNPNSRGRIAEMAIETYTREEIEAANPTPAITEATATEGEDAISAEMEATANAVVEAKPIPMKDGEVDYDAITDVEQFAEVFTSEMGDREAAANAVVAMRDGLVAEMTANVQRENEAKTPNDIIRLRKENRQLAERIAFYDKVINKMLPEESVKEDGIATPTYGLEENELSEQLTPEVRELLDNVAIGLGVHVVFEEEVRTDTGAYANADINGNKVRIAWRNRDKALSFLIGHEFTHRMQDISPETYAELKDAVKAYVGEARWNQYLGAMIATYEAAGYTIVEESTKEAKDAPRRKEVSITTIEDEIIADEIGKIVEDENAFKAFVSSEDVREKRTVLEAIKAFLEDLIAKLQGVPKKVAQYENMTAILDTLIMESVELGKTAKEAAETTSNEQVERYSIIGEQGASALDKAEETTIRLDDLAVAREMEAADKDAKAIRMATGWERGADGLWRYEIMDISIINPYKLLNLRSPNLSDIVDNADELFAAYPQLADIKVKYGKGMDFSGSYSNREKTIKISVGQLRYWEDKAREARLWGKANHPTYDEDIETYNLSIKAFTETLVHEIQHAIQHIEGFAEGGNSRMVINDSKDDLQKLWEEWTKRAKAFNAKPSSWRVTEEGIAERKAIMAEKRRINSIQRKNSIGSKGYDQLAGEVEARNVQKRMYMTPEERRATLLSETEDVAREDQIFLREGAEMAMAQPKFSLITPEMDASYLDAVERDDMETAQRMVMEAAEKAGYINDESWRMNHRAPRKDEENANPFNTEKIVPEDFWEHPEWYTNIRHSSETRESYYAMKPAIDKYKRLMAEGKTDEAENVTITMYRGVDKTANKREASFRNGDWITPSRSYALLSAPYGKARVISQEVKLNDIWWDGNSINEWGYDDGANYGYRDTKNNRKLLDPVTYDDNGNVIPLSERFNPRKDDIRYSMIRPSGEEVTFDNFFEDTSATFTPIPKGEVPQREPDYVSMRKDGNGVSSRYWYGEDERGKYVVRASDHWSYITYTNLGVEEFEKDPYNRRYTPIASCRWGMDARDITGGKSLSEVGRDFPDVRAEFKEKYDIEGVVYGKAYLDEFTKWEDASASALDMAEEMIEPTERLREQGAIVDAERGDVRYSIADILTGDQREQVIADLMRVTGRSRRTVISYLKAEESLANIILSGDNKAFLDIQVDESVPSIWSNSDYPQGTVEFSNICRKRLPFTMIYQRLQKDFPNTVFDASSLESIRQTLIANGEEVACGLCFVEDRRQLLGEIGQGFIKALKGEAIELNDKQQEAIARMRESGDTYIPNLYELITLDGMKILRKEHPEIANAFVAYNNARGMQAGRLFQAYSAYHRDILNYDAKKVAKINNAGGLRIFSFSDFEAHHLIDLVQVLTDCAAKGIKVQGYTKVPQFAKAVRDTKMKVNRSLIAKAKGVVDADYIPQEGEAVSPNIVNDKRLLFDTVEGIDVNNPNFFDSTDSKNVGNILVGISDEHIRIAMLDPFVDYIIGFHTGLSEAIREQKGIADWTNYKYTQLEKILKDGKLVNADKHGINIYTEVLTPEIKTERQFVRKYLKVCEEKGWIPKYHRFLNKSKSGKFIYTKGYYKLLLDFKMFDANGRILPQEVVVPVFDNEVNARILEEYVEGEKAKAPNDELYGKVVDAMVEQGVLTEAQVGEAMSQPKFSLSEETMRIFDAAKAKFGTTYDMREAGYILPDGSMLDFSGRHQVRGGDTSFLNGDRTVDHREISDIANDNDDNETGINTDLGDFLDRGAIRIDSNAGAINLNVAPTKAQKDRLKRLIERNDGYVYVDFGKGWDTEHYAEYEAARASRVLGDIDRYFDEGIKPTGNVRFSIIGEIGAANLDTYGRYGSPMLALEFAREFEAEGKSAKDIRLATNWERGTDGKWRYEILDGVYNHPTDEDITAKEYRLADILDNADLYKAYPYLKDIKVEYKPKMKSRGTYYNGVIELNASRTPEQINSTLLHEVQHAIQHIEMFATGGNTDMFKDQEVINQLMREIEALGEDFRNTSNANIIRKAYLIYQLVKRGINIDSIDSKAFKAYRRLAGEVESRNVQKRMGMTEAQRLETLLSATEDVARKDQEMLFDEYEESEAIADNDMEVTSAPRYSINSSDIPFFNDENGEVIYFDNTDVAQDFVEDDAPRQVVRRDVTEEVVRAYLKGKYLTRKERIRKEARQQIAVARQLYKEADIRRREGIASQRSNAGKVEYILGDTPYESLGFEDMALVAIAEGDVKIRWEDDGTRRGLASELGLSDGERKSYGQITKGATLTFEAFVHKWWESLGGYEKGIDTQDLRNALIEALMAANTANRALEILRKKYDYAEEKMNNAIYDIESERDRLLAAEDAAYAEQERELQNPATMRYYVQSYASNILFSDDLNTISRTIREMDAKIRATEEKVVNARNSREKRTEAIREMQESLAEAKDVLLEALSTYENLGFRRAEVQRLVDAVKGARTLRDISKVRTKVESILLNASIREKRNMMNKLIQLRLPNGELLETFVGTMVHDNRMSARDGKRIISDMWKGQNAKGVSVAKMVDDDTRILLENIRGMVMTIHKGHFVKEEVDGEEVRRYIPAAENTMDIPSSLEANEKRMLELIEKEIGGTITAEERTELEARSVYPAYLFVVLGKQNVAQKRKEIEELFERIKARREGDYAREEKEQDYAMLEQLQREHNECKKLYEQALDDFNDSINNIIIGGRISLREFRENKEKHKAEVIRMAIDAMGIEDKDINTAQPTRTEEAMAKYWRGLLNVTYWTFDTTLREIDRNAPNGEGKFYEYIMGRYVKAVNGLQVRTEQHIETLGDAVWDIWYRGEKISPQKALKKVIEKADAASLGIIMRYKVGEKKETPVVRQLRISNGLFVLAMWGQEQYRTIMMKHGIDEDFIAEVESRIREIDERYITLKDWVIKTMLPATREEYNKTHVELFGASMDNIANYFPAKVMEGYREVDMSKAESGLPSTMTGSIIKRQPHNNMIDASQSFFSVLLGHLQNMDHWASFSPLIEDINAILSNNDFKNRANTLFPGTDANRGGAGSLVQILKDTAAIAMDCYRVKHAAADELLGMMAGAWTASNISWRLSTAIKQLSGSVAFLTSEIDGVTQIMWPKNMATFIDAMKWASEMSPMFRKRWNGRFAGNEVLQQYAASQSKGMDLRKGKTSRAIDKVEDFVRFLTLEVGMLPNAAVDAVVVATGMKTIYDATLRKVTNGKPETATQEQKDIAMMKAEIFANETQQSAEGAYLSVPQAQRSAATTMATTYMNASYAAYRMRVGGAQEIIRAIRAKENPMSGVSRLLTGVAIDASFVAMGCLGRGLWNIILDAIDYEDDDESQINWKDYGIDVAISLGTGGILGGNVIQSLVSGYGVTALPAATEFFKDLKKATGISAKDIAKIKNGGVYGEDWKIDISLYALGNMFLKYRFGVDAETYVNMVRGVENICRDGDPLGTLQILNSPASTVNILVGRRRKGETVKEYVERRMRYEVIGKVPDFEDIYDEEIHYIGDGILDRVGGARDYELRSLYKEYAERQYNAVYNKMLTAAERAEYEILEKEYLEVCEALGWKPDRQPTLDTTKVDIPLQYVWKYHKVKGIATEMNKMRINMDRFVGTDSTYLEMLKARQAKKRELIETYNEYLR